MNSKKHFNEEDKANVVKFLNHVAKHAKFEMNTQEIVEYFKLLSFMQQVLLPKMNENILEVRRVIEPKEQAVQDSDAKKAE